MSFWPIAASSNRHAGSRIKKGTLVRCRQTHRLGIVIDVYEDIRISDLERIVRIRVEFPSGDEWSFSHNELEIVEEEE